jgi:antitoxin component YwqK of YwqJK toxin-antitoxin module
MNKVMAVTQLALCFVFLFCDSGGGQTRPPELVGQWEYNSGDYYKGDYYIGGSIKPDNVELFKDGTGILDGNTISWKVEGKRLVILSSTLGFACEYKVSGYELAVSYDGGRSAIFIRKGKLEEFKAKQAAAAEAEKAKQAAAAEKEKQERIVPLEKSDFITGYGNNVKAYIEVEKTYPSGAKKKVNYYVDNKSNLVRTTFFFEDGRLQIDSFFKNGKKDGEEIEYHYNGQKKRVRTFKLGDQDGLETEYFQNGNLKSEHIYVKNVKNGPFKMYNEKTGKLVESGEYLNGQYHGKRAMFDENSGRKKSEATYENGVMTFGEFY